MVDIHHLQLEMSLGWFIESLTHHRASNDFRNLFRLRPDYFFQKSGVLDSQWVNLQLGCAINWAIGLFRILLRLMPDHFIQRNCVHAIYSAKQQASTSTTSVCSISMWIWSYETLIQKFVNLKSSENVSKPHMEVL